VAHVSNGVLFSYKEEWSHVICRKMEILLSEIIQIQKDQNCMFSLHVDSVGGRKKERAWKLKSNEIGSRKERQERIIGVIVCCIHILKGHNKPIVLWSQYMLIKKYQGAQHFKHFLSSVCVCMCVHRVFFGLRLNINLGKEDFERSYSSSLLWMSLDRV
jgi:hypothetical protein